MKNVFFVWEVGDTQFRYRVKPYWWGLLLVLKAEAFFFRYKPKLIRLEKPQMKWSWNFFRRTPKLRYTWNGLSPEVLRKNWQPGDEYWVLIWWQNFNAQSVIIRSIDPRKGNKMNDNLKSLEDLTPFMADETAKLTDDQLDVLLAGKDIGYVVTDTDEDGNWPAEVKPALH